MSLFESFEKPIEPKPSEAQKEKESDSEVFEKKPKIEISVDPASSVEGLTTYSVLRRISESSWGRDNNVIDRKIEDLDKEERGVMGEKFDALMQKSNEEALEWVAFAQGKPGSIQEEVITQLTQHKGFDGGAAKKFFGETTSLINEFNDRHPKFIAVFKKDINSDIERKEKSMAEIEKYVDGAVKFFNPKKETTKMERIHLLPNDPLTPNEQGSSIVMGKDVYIRSTGKKDGGINYVNIVHESLHPIINPITQKIELNEQEKQKIKEMVSCQLKTNPGYKDNPPVLLNESLIRAYGLEFTGQKQNTLDDFFKKVDGLSEKEYRDILSKSAERGMTIDSGSLKEFKENEIGGFYNKYIKDELIDRIVDFYKDYAEKRKKGSCDSFEDYFLANYKELLK